MTNAEYPQKKVDLPNKLQEILSFLEKCFDTSKINENNLGGGVEEVEEEGGANQISFYKSLEKIFKLDELNVQLDKLLDLKYPNRVKILNLGGGNNSGLVIRGGCEVALEIKYMIKNRNTGRYWRVIFNKKIKLKTKPNMSSVPLNVIKSKINSYLEYWLFQTNKINQVIKENQYEEEPS